MKEMGEYLKNRRIELGVSLDEAEQYLKIRKKYLVAIEEGDESVLPGKTYFLGYLRNYASYLGVDQDSIDQMLGKIEHKPKPIENEVIPQRKKTGRYFSPRQRNHRIKKEKKSMNFAPFIKIGMIILIVGIIVFIVYQFLQRPKQPPIPIIQKEDIVTNQTSPSEEKSLEQELTEMAEENIKKEKIDTIPSKITFEPLPEYVPIHITATEPTWIKIMQDEEVLFESMLFSTEKIAIRSEEVISLITTNADTISILYDDQVIEPQSSDHHRIFYYQITPENENN